MMPLIRPGRLSDLEAICQLLIATWRHCYPGFMPASFLNHLSLERQKGRHLRYFQSGATYYVAENQQQKMLGFVSYGKSRFGAPLEGLELYTLYVGKQEQGRGVGKLLLDRVLEDLTDEPTSLYVSVFEDNPFKQFYLKYGFKKIGVESIELDAFSLDTGIYQKKLPAG